MSQARYYDLSKFVLSRKPSALIVFQPKVKISICIYENILNFRVRGGRQDRVQWRREQASQEAGGEGSENVTQSNIESLTEGQVNSSILSHLVEQNNPSRRSFSTGTKELNCCSTGRSRWEIFH